MPDIKIYSDTNKLNAPCDTRKKSILDSGIELFFKKSAKNSSSPRHDISASNENVHKISRTESTGPIEQHPIEERRDKWNPIEAIKIYTEKRKGHEVATTAVGLDGKNSQQQSCILAFRSFKITFHFSDRRFDSRRMHIVCITITATAATPIVQVAQRFSRSGPAWLAEAQSACRFQRHQTNR